MTAKKESGIMIDAKVGRNAFVLCAIGFKNLINTFCEQSTPYHGDRLHPALATDDASHDEECFVMFTEDQIRRFFKHVYKTDGCWLWTGHTVQSVRGGPPVLDYGVLRSGNKDYRAHRFAYLAFVGPIPEGMDICHKCDVPRCVNPDHLFPGTAADNAADKVAKGRSLRGSRNPYSKLTEDDVRSIRAIFSTGNVTRNDLAIQYGVYRSTISRIVRGDSWKHIL